jgi:hypothetical protein
MNRYPAQQNWLRLLAAMIYLTGVLLTLALTIVAVWADAEAVFYGFNKLGDDPLETLRCPVLVTPNQPGLITADFTNIGEKAINLTIHYSFSGSGAINRQNEKLPLEPYQTKTKTWQVTAQQVDMHWFIFAQIGHFAARLMPFRYQTCGMLMLPVPWLTGDQLFTLWFVLGVGGLVAGIGLWVRFSQPLEGKRFEVYRAMRFLAIFVLVSLLVALQGWWPIGILLLAGVFLTIASMLALTLMS